MACLVHKTIFCKGPEHLSYLARAERLVEFFPRHLRDFQDREFFITIRQRRHHLQKHTLTICHSIPTTRKEIRVKLPDHLGHDDLWFGFALDFLLEIGIEELPAKKLDEVWIRQLLTNL
jgi:hypothetical protein